MCWSACTAAPAPASPGSCSACPAHAPSSGGRSSEAPGAARLFRRPPAAARADRPPLLSYANRRRLEIARALATEPRLLLLDEPAAGMNPTEKRELMHDIRRIRERGVTVLVIEHDMGWCRGICERVVVLDHGVKIAEGDFQDVRAQPGRAGSVSRTPAAMLKLSRRRRRLRADSGAARRRSGGPRRARSFACSAATRPANRPR